MADGALVVDLRDRREVTVDPATPHGPGRRRRAVGGRRRGRLEAPPGGRRRHVRRHGRGRSDPRRRDRLAVRPRRGSPATTSSGPRSSPRPARRSSPAPMATRTCSGRCAAAAATSAWSRRSSSGRSTRDRSSRATSPTPPARSSRSCGTLPSSRRGPGRARADRRHRAARSRAGRRDHGPRRRGWPGQASIEPDVLRRLRTALPVIDDGLSLMEYPDLQAMSGRLPFGLRHYWKGHFLRALDESVIGGVVESMAARPDGISIILMEAIRGAAHTEPEGGAAFGQRAAAWNASALAIWDDAATTPEHRLGAGVGRPAVGRHAVRGRLRQLRPGRRDPSSVSGSPSATSASPDWRRSRRATTPTTGSGST